MVLPTRWWCTPHISVGKGEPSDIRRKSISASGSLDVLLSERVGLALLLQICPGLREGRERSGGKKKKPQVQPEGPVPRTSLLQALTAPAVGKVPGAPGGLCGIGRAVLQLPGELKGFPAPPPWSWERFPCPHPQSWLLVLLGVRCPTCTEKGQSCGPGTAEGQ